MKSLVSILLLVSTALAQPMIYQRVEEPIETKTPTLLATPMFDTGDLPANSGWAGTINLFVKVSGDAVYLEKFWFPLVVDRMYSSEAGMSLAFSFPSGATVTAQTEYYHKFKGNFVCNSGSAAAHFAHPEGTEYISWLFVTSTLGFWHGDTLFETYGAENGSSSTYHHVYHDTLTTSPSTRRTITFYTWVNGGAFTAFPTGEGTNTAQVTTGITDQYAHVKITFRIDIGATAGHLRLLWSCPENYTPDEGPIEVEAPAPGPSGADMRRYGGGNTNFSTTVLRGSYLTAHKLY